MESTNRYQIRLNDQIITRIEVRHALVDGVPCGELQVAIEDPVIGWFTIDDNQGLERGQSQFVLEVRANPYVSIMDLRKGNSLPVLGWRRVSTTQLLELLESTGVIIVRETL